MITVNKIEKIVGKKITDFDVIRVAIKIDADTKLDEYHQSYTFVRNNKYFDQLPSTPSSNDGKIINYKEQINSRLYYLKDSCELEDVIMRGDELIISCINTRMVNRKSEN